MLEKGRKHSSLSGGRLYGKDGERSHGRLQHEDGLSIHGRPRGEARFEPGLQEVGSSGYVGKNIPKQGETGSKRSRKGACDVAKEPQGGQGSWCGIRQRKEGRE